MVSSVWDIQLYSLEPDSFLGFVSNIFCLFLIHNDLDNYSSEIQC